MRVKAKWNVKGSDGWHMTGEIFETEEDYGDAVEVLDAKAPAQKQAEAPKKEPEKETKAKQEPAKEPEKEPEQETEKPKNAARRRKAST